MAFANSEHVAAAFRHFDADGDCLLNLTEYTALMQFLADASPFFASTMEERGGLEEAMKEWYEGACEEAEAEPEKGLTCEHVERELDQLFDGLDDHDDVDHEEGAAEVKKLEAALAGFYTTAATEAGDDDDDDGAAGVMECMRAEMEEMLGELDESAVEDAREMLEALSAAVAEDQTAAPSEVLSAAVEAARNATNAQATVTITEKLEPLVPSFIDSSFTSKVKYEAWVRSQSTARRLNGTPSQAWPTLAQYSVREALQEAPLSLVHGYCANPGCQIASSTDGVLYDAIVSLCKKHQKRTEKVELATYLANLQHLCELTRCCEKGALSLIELFVLLDASFHRVDPSLSAVLAEVPGVEAPPDAAGYATWLSTLTQQLSELRRMDGMALNDPFGNYRGASGEHWNNTNVDVKNATLNALRK